MSHSSVRIPFMHIFFYTRYNSNLKIFSQKMQYNETLFYTLFAFLKKWAYTKNNIPIRNKGLA